MTVFTKAAAALLVLAASMVAVPVSGKKVAPKEGDESWRVRGPGGLVRD
jgi:hypothetical protein